MITVTKSGEVRFSTRYFCRCFIVDSLMQHGFLLWYKSNRCKLENMKNTPNIPYDSWYPLPFHIGFSSQPTTLVLHPLVTQLSLSLSLSLSHFIVCFRSELPLRALVRCRCLTSLGRHSHRHGHGRLQQPRLLLRPRAPRQQQVHRIAQAVAAAPPSQQPGHRQQQPEEQRGE
jgi:hypothetical protein